MTVFYRDQNGKLRIIPDAERDRPSSTVIRGRVEKGHFDEPAPSPPNPFPRNDPGEPLPKPPAQGHKKPAPSGGGSSKPPAPTPFTPSIDWPSIPEPRNSQSLPEPIKLPHRSSHFPESKVIPSILIL